ncbi:hypothetical protein EJ08DRAFT_494567 [Tothia fuscella]|uniref:Phytochrome n=1 Tax=Tothia fuscella TaxID=1048955 RepID=A0A9P4U2P3_9PEZI|nr:hypothetical protein EJ08DRAFT_494567 [Tothia fuscella]
MLPPRPGFGNRIGSEERGFPIRVSLGSYESQKRTPPEARLPEAGPDSLFSHLVEDEVVVESLQDSSTPSINHPQLHDPHVKSKTDAPELPLPILNTHPVQRENVDGAEHEYVLDHGGNSPVLAGTRTTFEDCEHEQIECPGRIQSFGVLVALAIGEDDKLVVCMVSENSSSILTRSPSELFRLDNFLDIVSDGARAEFSTRTRTIADAAHTTETSADPVVLQSAIQLNDGSILSLYCAMHFLSNGSHDLLICEFEREPTVDHNPGVPDQPVSTLLRGQTSMLGDSLPDLPRETMLVPTSTQLGPYRVEGLGLVAVIARIQTHLSGAKTVQELSDNLVKCVQDLTRFHRVMVYRFDVDLNGEVISELIDPRASVDSYKNLRFPASDIPAQARKLYQVNKVRFLFDRDESTSRLVCRSAAYLTPALDLSRSYLRAMSPIHIKYLTNMGVRSTMSISLELQGQLWGLVCCHGYGSRARSLPFPIREMCYWIGLCASSCLEKMSYATKLQSREVLEQLQTNKDPQSCVTASSDDILKLFRATSGFMVIHGEARSVGRHNSYQDAITLLRYLSLMNFSGVIACQSIVLDYPSLLSGRPIDSIAGFLFIPLSLTSQDFLLLFRDHQVREVNWAGQPPGDKDGIRNMSKLEPRHSFKKWTEKITGMSEQWTEEQCNHFATMVQVVYGNFIEVWKQQRSLAQSRLKRALLLNASHEVRTPLNAIINYLEIALEKPLDDDAKDLLQKSHSASKSLVYVIDDLLSISNTQDSHFSLLEAAFDPKSCIIDAIEPLSSRAQAKGLSFEYVTQEGIPDLVKGDAHRFQQVVVQLVTNSIKHTETGGVLLESRVISNSGTICVLEICVSDTGMGLTEQQLDDLFQDLEQVSGADEWDDRDDTSQAAVIQGTQTLPAPPPRQFTPKPLRSKLGLGLSMVGRFIHLRDGQFRMKSQKGIGTVATLNVPWLICEEPSPTILTLPEVPKGIHTESTSSALVVPSSNTLTPPDSLSIRVASSGAPPSENSALPLSNNGYPEPVLQPKTLMESTISSMTVVIADDNSINLSVLRRRLEIMGHTVLAGRDGQECFDLYQKYHTSVQFVLMDIDMPLVDGSEGTRMIRQAERKIRGEDIATSLALNHRLGVPIFAVSATLRKEQESVFKEAGFDGWLLKPIDFKRLRLLLDGALLESARNDGQYHVAEFNMGGWFDKT